MKKYIGIAIAFSFLLDISLVQASDYKNSRSRQKSAPTNEPRTTRRTSRDAAGVVTPETLKNELNNLEDEIINEILTIYQRAKSTNDAFDFYKLNRKLSDIKKKYNNAKINNPTIAKRIKSVAKSIRDGHDVELDAFTLFDSKDWRKVQTVLGKDLGNKLKNRQITIIEYKHGIENLESVVYKF